MIWLYNNSNFKKFVKNIYKRNYIQNIEILNWFYSLKKIFYQKKITWIDIIY